MRVFLLILVFRAAQAQSACDFSYSQMPLTLSETCLYEVGSPKKIHSQLSFFSPKYPLWTDGAEKRRWIYLPPDKSIDTSHPDHWNFPVGTIFWKEFSLGGKLLETRVIKKVKDTREVHNDKAPINWIFGTYLWNESETEAFLTEWEVLRARGTHHTVPSHDKCYSCHGLDGFVRESENNFEVYRDFRPLGFAAYQLGGPKGVEIFEPCRTHLDHAFASKGKSGSLLDLENLIAADRLTVTHGWTDSPPTLPGNQIQRSLLGYLATNCSHCHSSGIPDSHEVVTGGFSGIASFVIMDLNVNIHEPDVLKQPAYVSLVGKKTTYYRRATGGVYRVKPGDYLNSAIWRRFVSSSYDHMPQTGSSTVDPYGRCLIEHWIEQLE